MFLISLALSFLPFILFAFLNSKSNVKKPVRDRQYPMPVVALIYCIVLLVFMDKLTTLCTNGVLWVSGMCTKMQLQALGQKIYEIYLAWGVYLELILLNTLALVIYVIIKRILTAIFGASTVRPNTFAGSIVELFYTYDEQDAQWYIKPHCGQACTFIKTAYYGSCVLSALALLISCYLCRKHLISAPFYPAFAVIFIGELSFFIDGEELTERKSDLKMQADRSRHVAMYPLLRKPLRTLFGDKLSAEGTTVNNDGVIGSTIEDILVDLDKNGGQVGKNYAAFIRKKMEVGLKPNVDYVRCGYDLATGKSLLFNTPFYDKLNPYIFYAMNRELLTGGKVLIVLGRHGTEEDLLRWTKRGMQGISNVPDLWKIEVLTGQKRKEDDLPDVGIISRSGVHDLDIHKSNLPFLRKASFVFIVEPSRLVTTAQIGLNLLIKCCGKDQSATFCSVDRNCDGLVDALSHILMSNITEVSATEYPHGMSSYMYWTADSEYLQHRIVPGVSRCLGVGTELSVVALKNQVKEAVWYGGDAYPVLDAKWIAKQYYYDLLDYAKLPTNQEIFDKHFKTSFNMCDERVRDYSFISVEDDRNNLFETRRNFATIAEQQGFVNVISSEYMLREYMAANTELFTADAKAIPYITADYARTKRNAILSLCLLLCIDSVQEVVLERQMVMLNIDTSDPVSEIWKEVCVIFGNEADCETDRSGVPILSVRGKDGKTIQFEKETTLLFKREYSVETGKFQSVYTIEDTSFAHIILDDLQNASYIAEQESEDVYIGTELKGHVYQKYMPGQFFTLNGKYYEMVSTTMDDRILVRRASEHIGGRLSYRQVRNYTIHHLEDVPSMGALKSVNNIGIHYQFADFSVETPGYWKLHTYNDFDNGDLVQVNGVPVRDYHHKQILKFDFSELGDTFTDAVRMTLTNLLNEVFVTLFADNQPFISAITPGVHTAPVTYSLALEYEIENADKCIFIIEDSQLDIGLLVAVERNIKRIFQIISDYLTWNEEQIAESLRKKEEPAEERAEAEAPSAEETEPEKKRGFFGRIFDWCKGLFKKKSRKTDIPEETPDTEQPVSSEQTEMEIPQRAEEPAEQDEMPSEQEAVSKTAEVLTPKQQKKAARAEKKEAKKLERAARKEEKAQRKQQKAAKKAERKAAKEAGKEPVVPADAEDELVTVPDLEESEAEVNEDE